MVYKRVFVNHDANSNDDDLTKAAYFDHDDSDYNDNDVNIGQGGVLVDHDDIKEGKACQENVIV